jgi:two-component sensor histidine kinase
MRCLVRLPRTLTVPKAKAIAADPRGGIWLGTLTGDLTFFREGISRTFPLKLKGKRWAYQIAVDPDGSVIAASDDGLVLLRAGQVQRLGKENGLPCDGVTGFAVDDNRNLWLNTPCGFIEIAASDVQRWWIQPDTIVQARVFGTLDGALPGATSFNPAAKSPDGRLWFVNNVVLQMIDPSHLSGGGTVPPVYVEAVVADRKQYKPQEGLQLPPLTRDLQIGYTAPSFLTPQKVTFRYRLDGHDLDWQDAGTRREAFYTELGPGKYRFRVIACDNNGAWNEAGASLDFSVAPAYYQTTWFRLSCGVAFLGVLGGLYQLRLRHLAREFNMRLDERVSERTRIARELHDTLLQNVQGLILKLHAIAKHMPLEEPSRQAIEKALDHADRVLAEGRDRVRNLRATAESLTDLSAAFQRVAEETAPSRAATLRTVVEGDVRELHPMILEESYSIGREALINAMVHSEGLHVEVEITYDARQFRLRIRDDGKGIAPEILEKGRRDGHWGLPGMRERAQKIGGHLEFWSRTGTGTEVGLTVPAAMAYRALAKSKSSWFRRSPGMSART